MAGRANLDHHAMKPMLPPPSRAERISPRAFTLVDLLAVLAVLALCATMLAPALARTRSDSRAFQCLNNHAQLTRAWRLYAADNNDTLAYNSLSGSINPSQPTWAPGYMDWSATSTDITNTAYLTDPRYSILAPYTRRDARLFKCPADTFLSAGQRSRWWQARVRSVSVNVYAATGFTAGGPTDSAYVQVTKLTGLLNPSPSETWVSLDEHPESINNGGFYAPRIGYWIDLPASYHEGGVGVGFADGHTEMHRWQTSVLNVPVDFSYVGFPGKVVSSTDPDVAWLRYRTPRKAGAN